MPHLSCLGCEPARCGNWAARRLEFKRTVGVPHGVRKRRGLNAIFRPPTRFSRDARVRFRRDAGLSCRWLFARQLKLVVCRHSLAAFACATCKYPYSSASCDRSTSSSCACYFSTSMNPSSTHPLRGRTPCPTTTPTCHSCLYSRDTPTMDT